MAYFTYVYDFINKFLNEKNLLDISKDTSYLECNLKIKKKNPTLKILVVKLFNSFLF